MGGGTITGTVQYGADASYVYHYAKTGNVVQIYLNIIGPYATNQSAGYLLFTLPESLRPTYDYVFPVAYSYAGYTRSYLTVGANGAVYINVMDGTMQYSGVSITHITK